MATTDRLDPAAIHARCLCLGLRGAARAVSRRYDQALAPVGLTNGQFSLLTVVAGHGEIGVLALAEALAMDRTTVTAALKVMEGRGLVALAPDPSDGRARRIALTDEGRAVLAEAAPRWAQAQDELAARLGGDTPHDLLQQLRALV